MGEMLLFGLKENVCVIILRPTVITSTYKEPFPGWIEGARTIDIFVLMYGKGKSNFMLGDPNTIFDAIPVDMVVNSMLASIIVHHHHHHHHDGHSEYRSSSCSPIYHVGSSSSCDNNGKPLRLFDVMSMLFRYFNETPWISKSGDLVRVRQYVLLPSMTRLRRYIALRYLPLLQVLKVMNMIVYHYFEEKCRSFEKSISMVIRFAEIYRPYVFFYGIFDDTNTKGLRERSGGDDTLFFDPNCIDWEDYFINTHFPGVVKYAF